MTISAELLAAYVDGELSELDTARVRKAIAEDPALAEQAAQMEALRKLLSARFDPVLSQPLPERLTAPLADAAKVVDLGAVREERRRWFERPALRYAAVPALAACLVAVLVIGRSPDKAMPGYAGEQLAAALDTTLSGQTAPDGTRLLISFRTAGGTACRAYLAQSGGGIACHDDNGWKLRMAGSASGPQGTEYQQAGSGDAAIMAAAQDLASGPALDQAAEQSAIGQGWKPAPR